MVRSLDVKTILFQTIQLSVSTVLMSKTVLFQISTQLITIWPIDRVLSGTTTLSTWVRWQWRRAPHSPKHWPHWNLIIRLFSVISRTLIRRVLPLSSGAVGVFYSPSCLGKFNFGLVLWHIKYCRLLMSNPVYTHILIIYLICKHILLISFLNGREFFFCFLFLFLHTVK